MYQADDPRVDHVPVLVISAPSSDGTMHNLARFKRFIEQLSRIVDEGEDAERRLFESAKPLLADLVGHDDWLPAELAAPDPDWYRQYLLYLDPRERFSVVSVVWGPGRGTAIYDLTVWGMTAVMEGVLRCEVFDRDPVGYQLSPATTRRLQRSDVFIASPAIGDIHRLTNALADAVTLSIHVYGANIATVKRYIYDPDTGHRRKFVSAYDNPVVPHITQSRLKVLLRRI